MLVLQFKESSISNVFTFSDFSLVHQLYKSGPQVMNYILEVPRYTNIVYMVVYLVLTYIERVFLTVCSFLS